MIGLTTGEMFQVSEPWVTPGTKRDAVLAVPALAAMLPSIEEAHLTLAPPVPDAALPARLAALTTEGETLDARHDNGMRGVFGFIGEMIRLARTEATRVSLSELRNQLMPEGLEGTRKTYRGEAGEAALLEQRLREKPALAEQMDAIIVHVDGGIPLGTFVREWMRDAKRLGEVDSERAALVEAGALPGETPPVTRQDARSARANWTRQVRAMLSIADAIKLSDEARASIFGDLEAAQEIARKRERTGKGS